MLNAGQASCPPSLLAFRSTFGNPERARIGGMHQSQQADGQLAWLDAKAESLRVAFLPPATPTDGTH